MSDIPPNSATPESATTSDENNPNVKLRRNSGFWARLGGGSLAISLLVHLLLIFVAVFWVISTWTDSTKNEPTQFATGAGGGNNGDRAKIYQHKLQQKNMKTLAKSTPRLTSKNPNASISLPDIPNVSTATMISGATAGGSSKGFGGGSGGGIGSGQGIGVGNGQNMIGKFKPVMGAKIQGTKVAVFMDASDSMLGYIQFVEDEIRKKFPDADVFKYKGIWMKVIGNTIMGGVKYNGNLTDYAQVEDPKYRTNPDTLTSKGKSIFIQHDKNYQTGCIGSWLDVMSNQKEYDALIIFSDLQDGVTQYREKEKNAKFFYKSTKFEKVYWDGTRSDLPTDGRTEQEKLWEKQLVKAFSGAKNGQGPRLYIFSSDSEPQSIFTKLVEASGGQTIMVRWLNPKNKYGDKRPADDSESVEIKKSAVSTPANSSR